MGDIKAKLFNQIVMLQNLNIQRLSPQVIDNINKDLSHVTNDLIKINKYIANQIKLQEQSDIKFQGDPDNIEGPVSYEYLVGDAGDGIMRKILLFGDVHVRDERCPSNKNNMSLISFFRWVAWRCEPRILDFFLEASGGFNPDYLSDRYFDDYLSDLIRQIEDCLKIDKSLCQESMRIHYVDNRSIIGFSHDLTFRLEFIGMLIRNSTQAKEALKQQVYWDPFSGDITEYIDMMLDRYRLNERRLRKLHPILRDKVEQVIIYPLKAKLYQIYTNISNANAFNHIIHQSNLVLESDTMKFDTTTSELIHILNRTLILGTAGLLDAYTVIRMLGRIPDSSSEGLGMILYAGRNHVIEIRDIMVTLGFELKSNSDLYRDSMGKLNQCMPYHIIRDTINDFCS